MNLSIFVSRGNHCAAFRARETKAKATGGPVCDGYEIRVCRHSSEAEGGGYDTTRSRQIVDPIIVVLIV